MLCWFTFHHMPFLLLKHTTSSSSSYRSGFSVCVSPRCPTMVHLHQHKHENMQEERRKKRSGAEEQEKRPKFFINDNVDILMEILKRLDGPSLGVAACVCRLWCTLTRNDDSLWEHLCFRHVSTPPPPSVRTVVVALGGYKRLYMLCVRPVLSRLGDSERVRERVWTRHDEVQLSLSLFCIDSYERLGGGGSGRLSSDASASSLMFLCNPVNV